MEIKLNIYDDDPSGLCFGSIKLLLADEFVFYGGVEKVSKLSDETFNSILADPGDVTLSFNQKEVYLLAKTIVAFYEMGGTREDD